MSSNLKKLVQLYRTLGKPSFDDNVFKGSLNEESFHSDFACLKEAGYIRYSECDASCGSTSVEVVNLPADFTPSINELCASEQFSAGLPEEFYIADLDYYHGQDEAKPEPVKKLFDANIILGLLVKFASHVVQEAGVHSLVFLTPKGKCEIECSLRDITWDEVAVSINRLTPLLELLRKGEHRPQKETIVSSSIITLLKGVPERKRFDYLLCHFDEFAAVVLGNYELFVSEFNFHDVLRDFEQRKLDILEKLDDIVSGVQGKILALPVAVVLASMKYFEKDSSTISNAVIFGGTLVFVIIILWLLDNQQDTLASITKALDDQKSHVLKDSPMLAEQLRNGFDEIEERISKQRDRLGYVRGMVGICFGASVFLFVYSTGCVKAAYYLLMDVAK